MKTDYKEHLIETISNIYNSMTPNEPLRAHGKMLGSLLAVVTTEQLESILGFAIKSSLENSNTEK
jgi:hypothetical protein